MTTKNKGVVAAWVLFASLGVWLWVSSGGGAVPSLTPVVDGSNAANSAAARLESVANREPALPQSLANTPATPDPATAATSELRVRVLHITGTEREPAAGVNVSIVPAAGDRLFAVHRQITDASGVATFPGLSPIRVAIETDHGLDPKLITLRAGQVHEVDYEIAGGVDVSGAVTDSRGNPVAGASVDVIPLAWTGLAQTTKQLATTDARGRFRIRGLPTECGIGARATGYRPSAMQLVTGAPDGAAQISIVLAEGGGTVEGTVVDSAGTPLKGVFLQLGAEPHNENVVDLPDGSRGLLRRPIRTTTGSDGTFRVDGLAEGEVQVRARARQQAPWKGVCHVVAGGISRLTITLQPAVVCSGIVKDADGKPIGGVTISVAAESDFLVARTRSALDGRYLLEGIAAGELKLMAESVRHGKARTTRHAQPQEHIRWDVELSRGIELKGRVTNTEDAPVPFAMVGALGPPSDDDAARWGRSVATDEQGNFAFVGCPDAPLLVFVEVRGARVATLEDVRPQNGPLSIRIPPTGRPSVHVKGTLVDSRGQPFDRATLGIGQIDSGNMDVHSPKAGTGEFSVGPLLPGKYKLEVTADGMLPVHLVRDLAVGETWDVGRLTLSAGGRIAINLAGATLPSTPSVLILNDAAEPVAQIDGSQATIRSAPLPPGRYQVCLDGMEVASRAVWVVISDGRDATAHLEVARGVPVAVQAYVSQPAKRPSLLVEIRKEAGDVVYQRRLLGSDGVRTTTCGLAPGRYSASATFENAVVGTAQFTVEDQAGRRQVFELQVR